jgi:hypothetical protein
MAGHIVLPWIHRVFALMKRWGLGTYHGLRRKHIDTYLNEFVFRYNRRFYRHVSFETMLGLASHHHPTSYWDIEERCQKRLPPTIFWEGWLREIQAGSMPPAGAPRDRRWGGLNPGSRPGRRRDAPSKVGYAADSPPEEAVTSEPVSVWKNSLLAANLQGISLDSATPRHFRCPKTYATPALREPIP